MRLLPAFAIVLCAFSGDLARGVFIELRCEPAGQGFTLRRVTDGMSFGDAMSQTDCDTARTQAREGVTCVPFGGSWNLVNLESQEKIGTGQSSSDCLEALSHAYAGLVCTRQQDGWRPTLIETGEPHGRFGTSLADCGVLTENASPGVVCTNTGTFGQRGRKPTVVTHGKYSDALLLGASGQQAFCARSTAWSSGTEVCACNGDFCGEGSWIRYSLATRKPVGHTQSLQSCIESQN